MSIDNIVYLCIFAAGFVLLGFMAAFGDADGDVEIGEVDGDVDAEAAGSPNAFSMKVVACFLVGFGAGAPRIRPMGSRFEPIGGIWRYRCRRRNTRSAWRCGTRQ